MWGVTSTYLALIVYLSLAYFIYKKFGRKYIIPLVTALALLVITNSTTDIVKHQFKRYRPTHHPDIAHRMQVVENYRGGDYGFFSAHASNSFGLCTFCFLILRRRVKGIRWIFLFAALHSISRVYLGVHYPSDIVVGALYGSLWGYLAYLGIKRYVQFIPTRGQGSGNRAQ